MEEIREDLNSVMNRLDNMQSEFSTLKESNKIALENLLPKVETLLSKRVSNISNFFEAGTSPTNAESAASLFQAAENGDVESIFHLLSTSVVNIRLRNADGDTALHIAARAGHERVVFLLVGNIPVESPGCRSRTPLHYACTHGHVTVVRHLLLADADVEAKDCGGDFALLFASKAGHLHVVEVLANHHASLDAVDKHGNSVMVSAAKSKQWDIVNFLLQRRASAEKYKGDENAPLYLVAKEKNYSLLTTMLKQGKQKEEVIELVLRKCNDAYLVHVFEDAVPGFCKSIEARGAMTVLAAYGKVDVLRAMLDRGADVNGFDWSNHTCLIFATMFGQVEVIKMLLDRGALVNLVHEDSDKNTALHGASERGHEECVRFLLESGASVNAKNKKSNTPIDLSKTENIRRLLNSYSSQS